MIKRLIWTIWTLMSSVLKKADKLNLSLSLSLSPYLYLIYMEFLLLKWEFVVKEIWQWWHRFSSDYLGSTTSFWNRHHIRKHNFILKSTPYLGSTTSFWNRHHIFHTKIYNNYCIMLKCCGYWLTWHQSPWFNLVFANVLVAYWHNQLPGWLIWDQFSRNHIIMMTPSNRNIFHVTGPLCGEFTGDRWIPRTKASDVELWCFLSSTSE